MWIQASNPLYSFLYGGRGAARAAEAAGAGKVRTGAFLAWPWSGTFLHQVLDELLAACPSVLYRTFAEVCDKIAFSLVLASSVVTIIHLCHNNTNIQNAINI